MRFRFVVTSAVLRGLQAELDADQPITVGRTGGNRLILDHKSVSRHHARIEGMEAGLRIVDLKSHNGTRVGEELVSERVVQPGDVLGFGEVRLQFIPVNDGAGDAGACASPTSAEAAGLPVLASAAAEGMALARPLSIDAVFGGPAAAPTAAMSVAPTRISGTLLYVLSLLAILVLGGLAFWKVGQRPPKEPVLDVAVPAGGLRPVHVPMKIQHLGEPTDQNIAFVTTTRFRGFLIVHGVSVGTTDVRLDGPDKEYEILRVLVRGVKDDPPWKAWLEERPRDRLRRAEDLIKQAGLRTPKFDIVNGDTSQAIAFYEVAIKLLEGIPSGILMSEAASKEVRRLRDLRDRKFDELSNVIEEGMREGRYKEVDDACQQLLHIYTDRETEEHLVVEMVYEDFQLEMAAMQREKEAKERR